MSERPFTKRERFTRAAWVGLAGGTLFGLIEAWRILAGNAAQTGAALMGVIAAMGFVVALDGALAAAGLGLLGAGGAQIGWLRRSFASPASWTALCIGTCAALLTLLLSLVQFGIWGGIITGLRAALFATACLAMSALAGFIAYWLAHRVVRGITGYAWVRRVVAAAWVVAALLPLAFMFLRSAA